MRTAPDHRIGMDYVHRSNFKAQQRYFAWCRGQAAGAAPAAPDFADLIESITLNLCTKFNYLPSDWYVAAGLPPSGPRETAPGPTPATAPSPSRTPRQASSVVAMVSEDQKPLVATEPSPPKTKPMASSQSESCNACEWYSIA